MFTPQNLILHALAGLYILWMAWRGAHRGATRSFLLWQPAILFLLVLFGGLQLAVVRMEWFRLLAGTSAALAVAVYFVAHRVIRTRFQAEDSRDKDQDPPSSAWLTFSNRAGGALLGMVRGAVHCLLAGLVMSMGLYAGTVWFEQEEATAEEEKAGSAHSTSKKSMKSLLRSACLTMAESTDSPLISKLPYLAEGGREFRALIYVLNAPKSDLEILSDDFGFDELVDIPEVAAALNDDEYVEQIQAVSEGKLYLLGKVAENPHTKELLACPEFRECMEGLTPSRMNRKLQNLRRKRQSEPDRAGDDDTPPSPAGKNGTAEPE